MRTTIRLDDTLLRRAKSMAAASGRSLNDFIEDAVRAAVTPRGTRTAGAALPTFKGGTLLPGVDLDDSASLLDLMDRPYPTAPAAKRAAEGSPRRGK
jgi:Arc/MetJ family transcription regulator